MAALTSSVLAPAVFGSKTAMRGAAITCSTSKAVAPAARSSLVVEGEEHGGRLLGARIAAGRQAALLFVGSSPLARLLCGGSSGWAWPRCRRPRCPPCRCSVQLSLCLPAACACFPAKLDQPAGQHCQHCQHLAPYQPGRDTLACLPPSCRTVCRPPRAASRVCDLTGKRANNGYNVTFSHKRNKTLQQVNLQYKKVYWPEGQR